MSDEVHDWLADLRETDELIASYVILALTALMKQGARLSEPLVASTQDAWPSALAEELDRRYAQMLEDLQPARRLAAESTDAAARERLVRLHARADAFRARKEVLKARYLSASAIESSLRDVVAEMERELGQRAWPDGLMELRPGAPGDVGIRVLFAVEPPGTALLLSVIEGPDAVKDHYGPAVVLSAEILRQVRASQEPEAAARSYPDVRSFLEEFQPDGFGAGR